ncbi:hypothetical protein OSB04_015230, partial [Centaurea solstitialis]
MMITHTHDRPMVKYFRTEGLSRCKFDLSKVSMLCERVFLSVSDQPSISTFASVVKRNNPSVIPLMSIWPPNWGPGNQDNISNLLRMADQPAYQKTFYRVFNHKACGVAVRHMGDVDSIPFTPGLDLYFTTLLSTEGNMTSLGTLLDNKLNSVSYPIDSICENFEWVHIRSPNYHTPLTNNFTAAHTAHYDPSSRVNKEFPRN